MKTTEIIYQLVNIDLEAKSGTLRTKPALPKNAPWKDIRVSLSPLLAHRIDKNMVRGLRIGDTFTDTKFSSTVCSKEFADNPFCLIEFKPGEKSDVPHNFQLRLVTEKRGIQVQVLDLYKNKHLKWQNRSRKAKDYLRYELLIVNKMMKDCGELNIVKPY